MEERKSLILNISRGEFLQNAFILAGEYPLAPHFFHDPFAYTQITTLTIEPATQAYKDLYRGTGIGSVMAQEVADIISPTLESPKQNTEHSLPKAYNSIRTGLTRSGREFELVAGSPEFTFGLNGDITLQDIVIKLGKYQDPRSLELLGSRSDSLISPWVLSKNYQGKFLRFMRDLTTSFASALDVPDSAIKITFDGYGQAVDYVQLSALLENRDKLVRLDLHKDNNISKVIIGDKVYNAPPSDSYDFTRTRPEVISEKFLYIKAIYEYYLKTFVEAVQKTQEASILMGKDFVAQLGNVSTNDKRHMGMAARIIYDTWPATLLTYWRKRISEPTSLLLQSLNGQSASLRD